mgnify:CR=1 FL=1
MEGLQNISPVDGRYRKVTAPLKDHFSEEALIRYRVFVEIEYFIALCKIPLPQLQSINEEDIKKIREIATSFSGKDAIEIKKIEQATNHDIKAVEYFIKKRFEAIGLGKYKEFIHFALTSQDINNTALPLSLQHAMEEVLLPALGDISEKLRELSNEWIHIPMLAHTHGQPASPTTMGKELLVFHDRLQNQIRDLHNLPYPAKFGGATGNFNAHLAAYPETDWVGFAEQFVSELGLVRSAVTTQIDHYDRLSAIFDNLKRICSILIDLDRDCWTYISMNYFKQKIKSGEVGSSAMPHKVNPIDFENAEGNAGIAIALFEHLSAKLPVSRLQRDLTDSTVSRNIGPAVAYMLIAIKSTLRGLNKITINKPTLEKDLEDNYIVVAEAIQTILRTLGYPEPYEALKELTRKSNKITKKEVEGFIDGLEIAESGKNRLKKLTPFNYTGIIPDTDAKL